MELTPWLISAIATELSMVSSWMYGNKSWKAPIVSLIVISIWVYYDIRYGQLPLLIPSAINAVISIRNLIKMHKEKTARQ